MADDRDAVCTERCAASGRTWTTYELKSVHSELVAAADDAVSKADKWTPLTPSANPRATVSTGPASVLRSAQTTAPLGGKALNRRNWPPLAVLLVVAFVAMVSAARYVTVAPNVPAQQEQKIVVPPRPDKDVAPRETVTPPQEVQPFTQALPEDLPEQLGPDAGASQEEPVAETVTGTGEEAVKGNEIQINTGRRQQIIVRLHGIEPSSDIVAIRELTNLIRRRRVGCRRIADRKYRCGIVGTDYDIAAYLIERGVATVASDAPPLYHRLAQDGYLWRRNVAPTDQWEDVPASAEGTPQDRWQEKRSRKKPSPSADWDVAPNGVGR